MKKKQKYWWMIVLVLVMLDQMIKWLVQTQFPFQKEIKIIPSFFSLCYVKNQGAAWSVLENMPHILLLFSLLVVVFLVYYSIKKHPSFQEQLSICFVLAGAIGNLLDRLFVGEVIDYLAFTFFNYAFPIFNFADICIVFGIFFWIFVGRRDTHGVDSHV